MTPEESGNWIRSTFEESPGVSSAQRWAFILITLANLFVVLMFAAALVLGVVKDVPAGFLTLIGGLQAVATIGKVWQSKLE